MVFSMSALRYISRRVESMRAARGQQDAPRRPRRALLGLLMFMCFCGTLVWAIQNDWSALRMLALAAGLGIGASTVVGQGVRMRVVLSKRLQFLWNTRPPAASDECERTSDAGDESPDQGVEDAPEVTFAALVQRYLPLVERLIETELGECADRVDEVAQRVFESLRDYLVSGLPLERPRLFLALVAQQEARWARRLHRRLAARAPGLTVIRGDLELAADRERRRQRSRLAVAVANLSPSERRAIFSKLQGGNSFEAIAVFLGISATTAEQRYWDAERLLREQSGRA
jgi:RNA polymerase sigma factor (sigma-70 family)